MSAYTHSKIDYRYIDKKIDVSKSKKFFSTSIVFSIITPLLFILFMYLQASTTKTDLYSLIFGNKANTVVFTIAMIQPFCGYVLKMATSDIREHRNINISQIAVYVVLISQLIVGNLVSFVCLALGIFNTKNKSKNIFKESIREIGDKSAKVQVIGCIFIILASILCTYIRVFRV